MDPFLEEIERQAREAADAKRKTEGFKYAPRITSKPGEGLEVEVELPDNHTPDEMFEAMREAAKLIGFE